MYALVIVSLLSPQFIMAIKNEDHKSKREKLRSFENWPQ